MSTTWYDKGSHGTAPLLTLGGTNSVTVRGVVPKSGSVLLDRGGDRLVVQDGFVLYSTNYPVSPEAMALCAQAGAAGLADLDAAEALLEERDSPRVPAAEAPGRVVDRRVGRRLARPLRPASTREENHLAPVPTAKWDGANRELEEALRERDARIAALERDVEELKGLVKAPR
jgi:hypothetical protein